MKNYLTTFIAALIVFGVFFVGMDAVVMNMQGLSLMFHD
jgi:hypothetical protein